MFKFYLIKSLVKYEFYLCFACAVTAVQDNIEIRCLYNIHQGLYTPTGLMFGGIYSTPTRHRSNSTKVTFQCASHVENSHMKYMLV